MKLLKHVLLLVLFQSTSVLASNIADADKLFSQGNYQQAYDSYLKSAELGNPKAYYQLARMHIKGLGVEQDVINGVLYYALAAEYGYHNSQQVVTNVLSSVSTQEQKALKKSIEQFKAKHGKQAIDKNLFPIIKQAALNNKLTFDGKEKLENEFLGQEIIDDALDFAEIMEETTGGQLIFATPQIPFLILDVDVAKDGSIRHYSQVQKYGDPSVTKELLDSYVLFPVQKPKFQNKNVDFVNRVYMGAATFDKFGILHDHKAMYGKVKRLLAELKKDESINGQFKYAMALLNFVYLKQEQEAEQILLQLAKLGHPGAMYEYGLLLYREQRDITQAIYWIGEASKYGLTRAEYRLAKILQSSPWVENDEKKSLFWFQQAASKQFIPAVIRATEIKLSAKDESLKDLQGAINDLAFLEDKHKNNPEYYYLLALSYMHDDNRDFKQAVSNLKTAIFKGQLANWDVSEWQDLLTKITTGNVTISDHS